MKKICILLVICIVVTTVAVVLPVMARESRSVETTSNYQKSTEKSVSKAVAEVAPTRVTRANYNQRARLLEDTDSNLIPTESDIEITENTDGVAETTEAAVERPETTVDVPEATEEPSEPTAEVKNSNYISYVFGNKLTIVSIGNVGLINMAKSLGETNFDIVEILHATDSNDILSILNEVGAKNKKIVVTGTPENANLVWSLSSESWCSAIAPISGDAKSSLSSRLYNIPVLALMKSSDPIYIRSAMQDIVRELSYSGNGNCSYIEGNASYCLQRLLNWLYSL